MGAEPVCLWRFITHVCLSVISQSIFHLSIWHFTSYRTVLGHLTILASICACLPPLTPQPVHPSTSQCIHPHVCLPVHPSSCSQSTHISDPHPAVIHPSSTALYFTIPPLSYPSITCPSMHMSNLSLFYYPSIHQTVCPSIHPSIIHPSIHPCIVHSHDPSS